MNVERAVVEFGAEAVQLYRAMAETRHDNEVSGSFLRSHVASRLHDRLKCVVHIDRLYTALAIDMGAPITPDLVTFLGAHRAHVALYADGRPTAIIELKVFDETTPLPTVGSGLDKAQMLQRLGALQIFVGVMICPITLSLEARIERLHDALGGNMYVGERQGSRDKQWEWCFACASLR
jgi:hypothetical protein